MFGYQVEGLSRLNIPTKKWGSSARVQVRNAFGRAIYIANVDSPKKQKLIAKYYKVSLVTLQKHLSANFNHEASYKFFQGAKLESHLYEDIPAGQFYDKLENIMSSQQKAYKINIWLGYKLVDISDGSERDYYPSSNTAVFKLPIAINSKSDINKKVISHIRMMEIADTLSYPSSAYKLKAINAFQIVIYYRNHALGSSEAVIPEVIRSNRHVINFPSTENKCVFHCIAYHIQSEPKKKADRIQFLVKEAFKRYCTFKNLDYSLKLYRNFKPIDILQFDELEDCFQLNIDVYIMDAETNEFNRIRKAIKGHNDTISILIHANHAMYITCADKFFSKHKCSKCEMVFTNAEKLRNHKKNNCDKTEIESFVKKPTLYRPPTNMIKHLLSKYSIKDVDHYIDHFIVYDFEAILDPNDPEVKALLAKAKEKAKAKAGENGEKPKTVFTNKHIPVSVSVCDSLTKEVRCFINKSPKLLLEEMFAYIYEKQALIADYNLAKFSALVEGIGKDDDGKLNCINQVPLLGFNSGRYDINLIKQDLFTVLGDEVVHSIKNPGYMCITTKRLKMLDISNYVPAGTSYDKYLTTYLGGCKCEDKIRCVCGLGKGLFPYEYITSFGVLNETSIPPKSAFDSKLRGTTISDSDYGRVKFVWSHYEMKSIKDLLIWYNNLDVEPFVEAIKAQRELFKRFELDMFMDGISLPGLSEKVMYQTCYSNLDEPNKEAATPFTFPSRRFIGYKAQDEKAEREFAMTSDHLNILLKNQDYLCGLCFCKLNSKSVSADRIDNSKGHVDGNILISCIECNTARKDMAISSFRYKKLLDYNSDRLVFSIDEEEADIYRKMKAIIAGGPSIIFNRYAKRNETLIRGEKLCKKIIGYDANALYLWALGNEMPCGRLTTIDTYEGIINDIKNDKIFGFLECDIETLEHLKDFFSELTPIFKNIEIDPSDKSIIGEHMFEYNVAKGANGAKKARKLIGSYFGKKILIYTPLLKWYLEHGLIITNMYCFIKANSHKAFEPFMEAVSDARREGDVDKSKAMIAEMMKLVGNSAFGRSGMDMSKHKQVKYETDSEKVDSLVEHFTFHNLEELNGAYELTMKKRRIKLANPIHLSIAIYQLAKLRMPQFYYDCIDYYFDRSDFQYQEMDTDSAYIAFSDDNPFPNLIKPELRQHFEDNKYNWFPRDYNDEVAKYDRRTPGLFKDEWRGDAMISLSSKNYICYLPDSIYKVKVSAKGIQQARGSNSYVLNSEGFETVIRDRVTLTGINKGFRICKETKSIITYSQTKTALNYHYDKRQVLADGITTIPLNM